MLVNPALVGGFLLLSALLSAIPGPSVLLETSRAITRGRRSAMWIVLGNAFGGLVLLTLVLAGLGAIVATSAKLFLIIKYAGAVYLLWLRHRHGGPPRPARASWWASRTRRASSR